MRTWKKLPDFQGVATDGVATLDLPRGVTYDKIMLVIGGTAVAKTDFVSVKVKANGKTFQEYNAGLTDLDAINDYYGRVKGSSYSVIHFTRDELRDFDLSIDGVQNARSDMHDSRVFGFGTVGLNSAVIEVTTSGAPADVTIEAFSIESAPREMGAITKVKYIPHVVGAGQNDIANIPTGEAWIMAMHLDKTANDITSLRVVADGREIQDDLDVADIELFQDALGRTTSGDSVVLDFCTDNDYRHSLVGSRINDLRVKPTCTTGGTINNHVEYIDTLNGV